MKAELQWAWSIQNNAKYVYSNGDSYNGDFRGDKKSGHGTITLYGGDIHYEGEFENDLKKGHGTVYVKSVNLTVSGTFDEHELIRCEDAEVSN